MLFIASTKSKTHTEHIINSLYIVYHVDSCTFPLPSTNPLTERSSQTHSKDCLCTKNSTTIYCNQTLCMGRGTWGALCVLLPCSEIAVNTFPLLSVLVDSGKQPRSVHYPPLPHWEEHHATFTTQHLLPSALQRVWRKWLLFFFILCLSLYTLLSFISVFITHTWLDLIAQNQESRNKLVLQLALV